MEKEQGGGGRDRSPEEVRAASNERRRKRYAEDPEYRERKLESQRRYQTLYNAEITARRRHRYATDPEYRAKYFANLLKRYGMSLLEYELRLALQGGVCAICKKKVRGAKVGAVRRWRSGA